MLLFPRFFERLQRYQVRISGSMRSFPNKIYGADACLTRLAALSYHKLATSMLIRFETLKGQENHLHARHSNCIWSILPFKRGGSIYSGMLPLSMVDLKKSKRVYRV